MPSLLMIAAIALLPLTSANAALLSAKPEPTFPLKLTVTLKAPPAEKAASKRKLKPALAAIKTLPPAAAPQPFVPSAAARIVPNGILSVHGPVQPIVSSGAPITPNGILSIPNAAPAVYLQPVDPATRDAEIAQLELTQFLYYDYPAQLRQLDSEIVVTQAEIVALENRLANYSRFDKFINNANPLFESQQLVNVALVEAQQRLSNLQYERSRIQQWLPVEIRRRQLDLHHELIPPAIAPEARTPAGHDATFDDDKER
ncbi:MAG: hypothetical protein ACR2FY_05855 [Pirellulaceae bacterium]